MRIAVMGSGGIGGNLGGLLARAGNEVTLIARGPHLEAIRSHGLRVKMPGGEFTVQVRATDDPAQAGPADLVIFTVKTYDNAEVIPALRPLVGQDTSVVSFQNGVETGDELAQVLGRECVLPGAAIFGAFIESPGVIVNRGLLPDVVFGEIDGYESPRTKNISEVFAKAGISTEVSTDVTKALWTKFMILPSTAGMTCAARTLVRPLMEHTDAFEMLVASMREIEAVGRAKGVDLDSDVVEKGIELLESVPWEYQVSMHVDIDRGARLEMEAFNGAVVRMGKELGVPTPVNQFLYTVLKPHINGAANP